MERRNRQQISLACGVAAVVILAMADLLVGDFHINLLHPGATGAAVLLKLRIPRIATAILAGAALSLSGLQMQSVFRNPLTDPHIMGISGGASLGAALAIMATASAGAAASGAATVIAALAGAVLAAMAVVAVSRRVGDSSTLLVFGVMIGFITSAITSVLSFAADEHSLKQFFSWSAGSFSANGAVGIACIAAALLAGTVLAALNAGRLDTILFGDQYAALCGTDPKATRSLSMAGCCLMTGMVTAFCGPIGFVGIVSPHLARWTGGTSLHRRIIPMTMVTGAFISLAADILSQASHAAVPVGSAMAIIGIPVIIYILMKGDHA